MIGLTPAQLASMQTLTTASYLHLADVWRLDPTSGVRTSHLVDVAVSVNPAKHPDRLGWDQGDISTRHTYTVRAALDVDLKEQDQLRNIRTADGAPWLPDMKLTVHTVAKWPVELACSVYEEA